MSSLSPYVKLSVLAYAAQFNENDLKFRRVRSPEEFIKTYLAGLRAPTLQEEQRHLLPLKDQAIQLLQNYTKLANIPFKILILREAESAIENNMPHTHADTIIIPETVLFRNHLTLTTLIHEQLHVFQRHYPVQCHKLYEKWGYRAIGVIDPTTHRSNPDNTAILYADSIGNAFNNAYNPQPKHISDIQDHRDHPNEVFAYRVSEQLVSGELTDEHVVELLT